MPLKDVKNRFQKAASKAMRRCDSFQDFPNVNLDVETATRYRYDAVKEQFVEDEVQVKMEAQQFNTELPGATRQLFRCKIISKLRGSDNYVAKRYMDHVEASRELYFIDCKMQMMAKKMADDFNKLKPPHPIDFLECFVLEFKNRNNGKPSIYCAERYIDGHYEKHSGNNGYVQEVHHRMTPHAFSHYTYVVTGGRRMIVDIQGVGDLWTDPQVHCTSGKDEFGVGNTGLVGMAKFFRTYHYNPLCEWIGLTPFVQNPHDPGARCPFDWNEVAHEWRLSDLARKPNAQRAAIARRSARLGGDVHMQLAAMYQRGQFGDEPDPPSALFHLEAAGALGHGEANVTIARLYSGIRMDGLPDVAEDASKAFRHWLLAAHAGDLGATLAVAQYYEGAGGGRSAPCVVADWRKAVKYYQLFLARHHELEENDPAHESAQGDVEKHAILAKLASLYETGGPNLPKHIGAAAALYNEAASEAEEHLKAKLASKYYDKAAQLEGDEEASEGLSTLAEEGTTPLTCASAADSIAADLNDAFGSTSWSEPQTPTPFAAIFDGTMGSLRDLSSPGGPGALRWLGGSSNESTPFGTETRADLENLPPLPPPALCKAVAAAQAATAQADAEAAAAKAEAAAAAKAAKLAAAAEAPAEGIRRLPSAPRPDLTVEVVDKMWMVMCRRKDGSPKARSSLSGLIETIRQQGGARIKVSGPLLGDEDDAAGEAAEEGVMLVVAAPSRAAVVKLLEAAAPLLTDTNAFEPPAVTRCQLDPVCV